MGLLPKGHLRFSSLTYCQRCLQKGPRQCYLTITTFGMVYQKQNNTAAARKHLQRALQINPNFPAADEIRKNFNQMS